MPEIEYDEEFEGGVLKHRVARTVSDAEIERREDSSRLRQAQALLRSWAQDAAAVAAQAGNVTQPQLKALFDRFDKLCRLQVRIIRKVGEDDGA